MYKVLKVLAIVVLIITIAGAGAVLYGINTFEPVVELDDTYSSIEFIGCTGELLGDKVKLSDIAAFEFAGFTVRK